MGLGHTAGSGASLNRYLHCLIALSARFTAVKMFYNIALMTVRCSRPLVTAINIFITSATDWKDWGNRHKGEPANFFTIGEFNEAKTQRKTLLGKMSLNFNLNFSPFLG